MISPHPYTNQDIVALARGPIVYCVEDFDNPWVDDHFKSLCLDVTARVEESRVDSESLSEPYVKLTVHDGVYSMQVDGNHTPTFKVAQHKLEKANQLHFIPYALRANRGGKGHMRVGLRRRS